MTKAPKSAEQEARDQIMEECAVIAETRFVGQGAASGTAGRIIADEIRNAKDPELSRARALQREIDNVGQEYLKVGTPRPL